MKAKRKVEKRHLFNVDIIKCNFEKIGFPDANVVLFTVVDLPLSDFKIWNRRRWCNSRIVTFGPPPIPIKPV
jgi:hypothetical protein